MKKNEGAEAQKENQLIWKLKDKPSATEIASLVEQKVIKPEEARELIFRVEEKKSEEVEALKEMVRTLQELVKDLLTNSHVQYFPYQKVIEVPVRQRPYWQNYWTTTGSPITTQATTSSSGGTVYTLSLN